MKERPMLFSAPMVRALLEGRKTQTRRIVKWNNRSGVNLKFSGLTLDHSAPDRWELLSRDGDMRWNERAFARCPYGKPGDRLWVRETFALEGTFEYDDSAEIPKDARDGRPVQRHEWAAQAAARKGGEMHLIEMLEVIYVGMGVGISLMLILPIWRTAVEEDGWIVLLAVGLACVLVWPLVLAERSDD